MSSTTPAKSQSLHNFILPHHLKWSKDGQLGGYHQRRRSIKSPSRRPNTSSPSLLRQSLLRDSVSAMTMRHQSPLRESISASTMCHPSPLSDSTATPSLVRRDYYLGKQSSAHGESPDHFPVREWAKRSPIGSDLSPPHLRWHDSSSSKGKDESVNFQNQGASSPNLEQLS